MICPCINCPAIDSGKPTKRHIGCRKTCEEWKQWQDVHKVESTNKYKDRIKTAIGMTHSQIVKHRVAVANKRDKR